MTRTADWDFVEIPTLPSAFIIARRILDWLWGPLWLARENALPLARTPFDSRATLAAAGQQEASKQKWRRA